MKTRGQRKEGRVSRSLNDMPAFPTAADVNPDGQSSGLRKRELFAVMAMQGMCVNAGRNGHSFNKPDLMAKEAVLIADALIAELEKKGGSGE